MDPDLRRILENVQMMIGQGAPESDVTAYLRTEGHTLASLDKAVGNVSTVTEPTPQPALNEANPAVGGAFDAAMSGLALPLRAASPLMPRPAREQVMSTLDEIQGRAPGPHALMKFGAPAAAAGVGAGGALMRAASAPKPVPIPRNPMLPANLQTGRAAAETAGGSSGIMRALQSRALRRCGLVAAGSALEALRRMIGGN